MKMISIVCPCYNEEGNIEKVYLKVKEIMDSLPAYSYEHIFIDNASKDNTVNILKSIAEKDKNAKIIVNIRNFGYIRSPYYALFQTKGDAVVYIASDLQDPPYLIKEFIKKWEDGYKVVIGVKTQSHENKIMFALRNAYYTLMEKISETEHIRNFTGFGIYDRKFIDVIKTLNDPYPYLRGIIAELGFDIARVEFTQPKREKGKTSSNFYKLYDVAMLGIVSYSKVPLRLAVFVGFVLAAISLLVAFIYLIYKLLFWTRFQMGAAPVVIGLFFFSAVQLLFIGIIGEYIGAIYTQTKARPLVIEKERINF